MNVAGTRILDAAHVLKQEEEVLQLHQRILQLLVVTRFQECPVCLVSVVCVGHSWLLTTGMVDHRSSSVEISYER